MSQYAKVPVECKWWRCIMTVLSSIPEWIRRCIIIWKYYWANYHTKPKFAVKKKLDTTNIRSKMTWSIAKISNNFSQLVNLIHEEIVNGKLKENIIFKNSSKELKVDMLSANCDDTYLSYLPQDIKHELMYFPQETNTY